MISARPSVSAPPASARETGWSLRNRLMLLATGATLLAWLAGGVAVYVNAVEQGTRLFDEHLHDVGRVVLSFADHEIDEVAREGRDIVHVETATTLGSRYKYQIWSPSGEALLFSFDAPRTPFAPLTQKGFVTRQIGGVATRTHVVENDTKSKIAVVAEPVSAHESFTKLVVLYLAVFFVASLVVLLPVYWAASRRATRALRDSATQLLDRSPTDLRPLRVNDPPQELVPLIASMAPPAERGPGPLGRRVGRARRSVGLPRRRFRQRARDDKPSATEIGRQREQVYGARKKAMKRRKHIVHLRRRRNLSREMKYKVGTYLMKEALEIPQVLEIALPPTRSWRVFLDWIPRNAMNLGSFGQQAVAEVRPDKSPRSGYEYAFPMQLKLWTHDSELPYADCGCVRRLARALGPGSYAATKS